MRRTGWLLLAGCLALAAAVGWIFQQQKAEQAKAAPKRPDALPKGTQSVADNWRWSKNEGDRPIVEVVAKRFSQQNDPPRVDLETVELKLFHKDGKQFDLVKSAKAELRLTDNVLYSDGDVEITMGLQSDPEARNRLVTIYTSGVSFDTATGRASTERPARFLFENSEGSSTGAAYDPALRELTMQRAVKLHWSKSASPMDVEAGHLVYKEDEQKIYLSPWSKLRRSSLTLNAQNSLVHLNTGQIELVEAENAKGEDRQPKRTLEYAADKLFLRFAEKSVINKIDAEGNARIVNTASAGRTTVTARNVNLDFLTPDGASILHKAHATGATRVESTPPNSAARVLKSEVVELTMRPNGEEIDQVLTHSPGEIEFLPKTPADRYRKMNGDRF
jgi:LPS export ABC transporter protein LptC